MDRDDQNTDLTEWLYLEPDGELTSRQLAELDRRTAESEHFARERRELAALDGLLQASKIEVREGFADTVLDSLPPAGWSTRHPASWWVAVLALIGLGGASALLTGLGAARLQPASPFGSAIAAVADMIGSALQAGAGLVGGSWRGVGLAVGDWVGASAPNTIAFIVLVVGVNWLFWRSLRRRPRSLETSAEPVRDPDVE